MVSDVADLDRQFLELLQENGLRPRRVDLVEVHGRQIVENPRVKAEKYEEKNCNHGGWG